MHATDDIRHILELLKGGTIDLEEGLRRLEALTRPYVEVDDFARVDIERKRRTGIPEIIYTPGKSPEQVVAIARTMRERGIENILATRAPQDLFAHISCDMPAAVYHPLSRIIVFNPVPHDALIGAVGIVTAGTSDLAVAEEVEIVCHALGSKTVRVADAGVSCLQRATDAVPSLAAMNVVVCIAGMEASLPSVLGGLLAVPVIAVPSSGGYGVNTGGFNALLSVLGTCVPGVVAVNIDNGVGAAAAAHRINLLAAGKRP